MVCDDSNLNVRFPSPSFDMVIGPGSRGIDFRWEIMTQEEYIHLNPKTPLPENLPSKTRQGLS